MSASARVPSSRARRPTTFPRLAWLVVTALTACVAPHDPFEGTPSFRSDFLQRQQGDSWVDVGVRLLSRGEPEAAEMAFVRSLNDEGRSAEALSGLAVAAEEQGQYNKARRFFELAQEADPDSVLTNNNLGVALYRAGEYHAAKQAFDAAFALSNGASEVAAHNLELAEAAIRQEAEGARPNPALSHRVVRLGSSEYRLVPQSATEENGDQAP